MRTFLSYMAELPALLYVCIHLMEIKAQCAQKPAGAAGGVVVYYRAAPDKRAIFRQNTNFLEIDINRVKCYHKLISAYEIWGKEPYWI